MTRGLVLKPDAIPETAADGKCLWFDHSHVNKVHLIQHKEKHDPFSDIRTGKATPMIQHKASLKSILTVTADRNTF